MSTWPERTLRSQWACSSKGRIVILGRIVSASGQIFRSDFRPQDEIFRPGMPFRPLDEQAPSVSGSTPLIWEYTKIYSSATAKVFQDLLKVEFYRDKADISPFLLKVELLILR